MPLVTSTPPGRVILVVSCRLAPYTRTVSPGCGRVLSTLVTLGDAARMVNSWVSLVPSFTNTMVLRTSGSALSTGVLLLSVTHTLLSVISALLKYVSKPLMYIFFKPVNPEPSMRMSWPRRAKSTSRLFISSSSAS